MIVDTSVLLALLDTDDAAHDRVVAAFDETLELLVISPLVLAEVDYLLQQRGGVAREVAGMRELASGAWDIASFTPEDLADAMSVVEKYPALKVGATDASLVVLADRYRTHTIATLDRRHFEILRGLDGKPFDLVPAP